MTVGHNAYTCTKSREISQSVTLTIITFILNIVICSSLAGWSFRKELCWTNNWSAARRWRIFFQRSSQSYHPGRWMGMEVGFLEIQLSPHKRVVQTTGKIPSCESLCHGPWRFMWWTWQEKCWKSQCYHCWSKKATWIPRSKWLAVLPTKRPHYRHCHWCGW